MNQEHVELVRQLVMSKIEKEETENELVRYKMLYVSLFGVGTLDAKIATTSGQRLTPLGTRKWRMLSKTPCLRIRASPGRAVWVRADIDEIEEGSWLGDSTNKVKGYKWHFTDTQQHTHRPTCIVEHLRFD